MLRPNLPHETRQIGVHDLQVYRLHFNMPQEKLTNVLLAIHIIETSYYCRPRFITHGKHV